MELWGTPVSLSRDVRASTGRWGGVHTGSGLLGVLAFHCGWSCESTTLVPLRVQLGTHVGRNVTQVPKHWTKVWLGPLGAIPWFLCALCTQISYLAPGRQLSMLMLPRIRGGKRSVAPDTATLDRTQSSQLINSSAGWGGAKSHFAVGCLVLQWTCDLTLPQQATTDAV